MPAPKSSSNKPATPASAAHALMSKSPAGTDSLAETQNGDSAARSDRASTGDADEAKAAQLGIRPLTGPQSQPRHSNLRRSSHALQLFGLLFVVMLLLFGALLAGIFSFYEKKIQPYLVTSQTVAQAPAKPEVPAALKIDIPENTRNEIAASTAKITELQKQIDALRDSFSTTDGRLKELGDRVSAAATAAAQSQPKPADVAPTLATDGKPDSEVASITQVASSSNQELVLLKERNRLTAWADEAIASGNRKSLENLIKRLTDPDFANLRDAAFAEIQRIYYHLRFTIRIDPNFRIPVNEMFKDAGIRDEADLKTEQLIKLLHDHEQPWQVRLRAAWLMGGRRTSDVTEALMKSIKEDPVLDVAKEAQLSLEQNIDRKFLLLDLPAIDEWWKSQSEPKDDSPAKTADEKKTEPAAEKSEKSGKKKSAK